MSNKAIILASKSCQASFVDIGNFWVLASQKDIITEVLITQDQTLFNIKSIHHPIVSGEY